jgi:FkbM family methyltransferase
LRADGRSHFPRFQKLATRWRLDLRRALAVRVVVSDEGEEYVVVCNSLEEVVRARRFIAREEGTVAWLREEVRPGDVFYDVGANIGVFTLIAGKLLGPTGHVYAFEPHAANAVSLAENVAANDLAGRVSILPFPLEAKPQWGSFLASSPLPGTASSSFVGGAGSAEAEQIRYAPSVDSLIEAGVLRPPNLVKVDVDGGEAAVVRGMTRLLQGTERPRAIQAEVNLDERDEVVAELASLGYELTSRHYSAAGQDRLAAGQAPDQVAYNGVFRPR